MEKWSEGIYLLGKYNELKTGCWLLAHGGEGAILEMPPYSRDQASPTVMAREAAQRQNLKIKYLLGTHCHWDHISARTTAEFTVCFPEATLYLQRNFHPRFRRAFRVILFDASKKLDLGGEPLYLVYAPKHSMTDTMVIFRGTICTGDWELNTIRSVHDGKPDTVPMSVRLRSIARMTAFEKTYDYRIHRLFSSHANDRRDNVNFGDLMQDTKNDRELW